MTDIMECPYCGAYQENMPHMEGEYFEYGQTGEQTCESCGKIFKFRAEPDIEYYYDTNIQEE